MSAIYQFSQLAEISCADIASRLADRLTGCQAVNTSFDSGRLVRPDWEQVNGYAITPPITPDFIAEWPVSHIGFCDEWWVFDRDVPEDFGVSAFCNRVGMRISEYQELDFDGGCPLDRWLSRFTPKLVFGNNELGYVISRRDDSLGEQKSMLLV
ncbi:MAG: hypothetical protein EOP84_20470 [Verrucomicrobiaceae bacterium]|nr:MAG: hypothetical protein EOP84_20470 [Verrucomicrobiaceae bacterium]